MPVPGLRTTVYENDMQTLHIILAAIIVLGPLIAIHEFGHFWVARRLGVKVITFSIGFGPGFLKWRDRAGTTYQIAAIPLGGYVRMADEREGEVPAEDVPRAFNRQPVWARMAIVAAGPLINLLFAVLLYWIVFLQGVDTLRTVVGRVAPASPAAMAGLQPGDEILSIDGRATPTWEAVSYALIDRMGESGDMTLVVRPDGATAERTLSLALDRYLSQSGAEPMRSLGFTPYEPKVDPVIGEVVAGGAGERQGLLAGDRIVSADGVTTATWLAFVDVVQAHPGKAFPATVERNGQLLALTLTPAAQRDELGRPVGKLGIAVADTKISIPPAMIQRLDYGPVEAMGKAVEKTGGLIAFTLESLAKMVRGLISVDNLSGPITIAKVAGQSASLGWEALVGFMALLSVSLGVLNLLPIPVLDGGHLVYYAIEGVLGRPLSEKTQMVGLRIGIVLMGSLMLLAIFNDLSRLF